MAADAVATRRRIIPRPRLTRLLDENPARIKLLIAPAGYGKTVLAHQWLDVPSRRTAWYRAGSAASDVAALGIGLANAAAQILPEAGKRMAERLRATGDPEQDVEILVELLAEDLQAWPDDAWLAIDDYQFVMESGASERFIDLVSASSPVRLVITSRQRPAWASARRIVYGEIQELDRRQLAMSASEANEVSGRRDDAFAALVVRARGWPAVIGLAAASSSESAPPEVSLPPALYDYFAEEVYQQLGQETQFALCRLSVPPVITPDLCHFLLGSEDLDVALRLGVLEDLTGTYEMHPLLRTFLETKLRAALGEAAEITARQVVDWLLERGAWDESFDVIDRFRVHDRFERLVSAGIGEIIESGRTTTLGQWVDFAASHHLFAPVIEYAEAELAFRRGEYGTAAVLAASAAHSGGDRPEYDSELKARILLRAGQSALLDSRERDALRHFEEARTVAPQGALAREALIGQFFASVDLGLTEAEDLLEEVERYTSGTEDAVRLSIAQMLFSERTGGLANAVAGAHDTYPLLPHVADPVIRTSFLNSYGQSLCLLAHYERALGLASEVEEAADAYRLRFVISHAAMLRGMAAIGLKDLTTALAAIEDAEAISEDPHIRAGSAIMRARIALIRGRPDEALEIASRPIGRYPSNAMSAELEASRALAALASGDHALASKLCSSVLRDSRFARGGATTARLVQAHIQGDERGPEAAVHAIESALTFAFDGGRMDEFVAVYRALPTILAAAMKTETLSGEATAVVCRANDARLARRLGFEVVSPLAGPAGRLTPREREVLVLVARGFTNKDIAGRLVISESTVKVHVRHVLAKLGASSRAEAAVKLSDVVGDQATDATTDVPSSS